MPSVRTRASKNFARVLGHRHDVAVVEIHDFVRDPHQSHGVACNEVFPFTQAHHHGRTLARAHDALGMALVENGHRISAGYARERLFERFQKIVLEIEVDQVRQHFGIGLTLHGHARGFKLGAQLSEVFDDAVVHKRNAVARDMRVRIGHHRTAVRGPARVRDADGALHAFGLYLFSQVLDARHAASAIDFAVAHDRHAAAIVAAVFKAFQPLQKNGNNVPAGYAGHNSAHDFASAISSSRTYSLREQAASTLRSSSDGHAPP